MCKGGMNGKYCGGCQWFSPDDHLCLCDESGVFLTGEGNTCQCFSDDYMEAVRCGECTYYEIGKDYLPYCNHPESGLGDYPQPHDFCSYGKRRDDRHG